MIQNLKPLGGFIENTIRPLVEEFRSLIQELKTYGVNLDEDLLERCLGHCARLYVWSVIVTAVTQIIVASVIFLITAKFLK